MHLNINDDSLVRRPTGPQVASTLKALEEEQYVILSRDDDHYVQVFLNEDRTYQLEYRDGSEDQHYGADPDTTSLDSVCRAFELFLGGNDLSTLLTWERIDATATEPGEDEVEYNGVVMDAGWPAQIEAAQAIHTVTVAGKTLGRIPFGSELNVPTAGLSNCGDCGVVQGQLHVPTCDIEQCPGCSGQLISCGCRRP